MTETNELKKRLMEIRNKDNGTLSLLNGGEVEKTKPHLPSSESKSFLPDFLAAGNCVPNLFLRSSLFSAASPGRRPYLSKQPITSVDGFDITYTGQKLNQNDLDCWMGLVGASIEYPLGFKVPIVAHQFLKTIGRSGSKQNYEWLQKTADRLVATGLKIKHGKSSFTGSLLPGFSLDEETGKYLFILNPNIACLFQKELFTSLQLEERRELQGKLLALWLHGFYSSHAKPFPYKISTIYELSGSEEKSLRSFKQTLARALNHVCETTGWSFHISNGKVSVITNPSRSQQRHLSQRKELK